MHTTIYFYQGNKEGLEYILLVENIWAAQTLFDSSPKLSVASESMILTDIAETKRMKSQQLGNQKNWERI